MKLTDISYSAVMRFTLLVLSCTLTQTVKQMGMEFSTHIKAKLCIFFNLEITSSKSKMYYRKNGVSFIAIALQECLVHTCDLLFFSYTNNLSQRRQLGIRKIKLGILSMDIMAESVKKPKRTLSKELKKQWGEVNMQDKKFVSRYSYWFPF